MNFHSAKEHYLDGDFKLKGEFKTSKGRDTALSKAERYAAWTLPIIMPQDGDEDEEMQHDYQSVGAQAVTNLSNKIMMALFQPSRPFFKMDLSKEQRAEVSVDGSNDAAIDEAMASAEREAIKQLDKRNGRVVITDSVKHLVVTGNTLLKIPKKVGGMMSNFSIRDYAILRDLNGEMVKCIVRETKEVNGLSDELAELAMMHGYGDRDDVSIYTGMQRVGDKYLVWQELEDICYCSDAAGYVEKNDLEYIPLTWNLSRGRNYGTGLVEEYSGDFHTLSNNAEAKLDYTSVITDVKFLVNPTGMTDVRKIKNARSGAYVQGREEDISVLTANIGQVGDYLDNEFQQVSRRIGIAFLMNSSVTRDAERVTAEEVRMQATELENSLGGVYSRLARELQLPLAAKLMEEVDPVFKQVEPVIITGLESLSRSSELDRWRMFFNDLVPLSDLPPELAERVDPEKVYNVLGAGHGVEPKKIMYSEKEVQANRAQAAQQQAAAAGAEAGAVAEGQGQPNG